MVFANLTILLINISLVIFSYLVIKKNIEKKILNKTIIDQIKKEINSIIVNINDTTVTNINLMEDKIKKVQQLMSEADKKSQGLEIKLRQTKKMNENNQFDNNITYSAQKIVKKSHTIAENVKKEQQKNDQELAELLEIMKNMPMKEKVVFLNQKGFNKEKIRKIIQLDKGEFELLLDLEDIRLI